MSEWRNEVTFHKVTVEAETDLAILCMIPGFDADGIWIPKSQVSDNSEVHEMDTEGDLVINQWIAEMKGLV